MWRCGLIFYNLTIIDISKFDFNFSSLMKVMMFCHETRKTFFQNMLALEDMLQPSLEYWVGIKFRLEYRTQQPSVDVAMTQSLLWSRPPGCYRGHGEL